MAIPSAQTLQRLAGETGFQPGVLEKALRLLELLQEIALDPVLSLDETVAGKIVALVDRHAVRDLFDARRILSIEGLDWRRIKVAVLAIGASGRRDWRTVSAEAIDGRPRHLRHDLAVLLPADRFSDTSEFDAWIDETVALCRDKLAFLFELSESEKAFSTEYSIAAK